MKTVKQWIEKYLLLWLIMLCLLAFYETALPIRPFTGAKPYLKFFIAVTMFAVGWMLPVDEVREVITRWPTVLGGTLIQYTIMPILAYFVARQFQLTDGQFIGVIMVGCVPGAMASNVLTLLAGGNTGYSVSLTTTATLLSPIVVPLAMAFTLHHDVDASKFIQAALELSWMVAIPVLVGHLISRSWPQAHASATVLGSIVANLTILWIVAFVVAANRERLGNLRLSLFAALLGMNLLGYVAGYLGGTSMRLPDSMRRALTLEVGMQNAGLGTTLVTSIFPDDPSVAIPPAIYTFLCMLTGTILSKAWSSRAKQPHQTEPN